MKRFPLEVRQAVLADPSLREKYGVSSNLLHMWRKRYAPGNGKRFPGSGRPPKLGLLQRLVVCEIVASGEASVTEVAAVYGVTAPTIRNYLGKEAPRRSSLEDRLEAVEMYRRGMASRQLGNQFGVGPSTIQRWVRKYDGKKDRNRRSNIFRKRRDRINAFGQKVPWPTEKA